MNPGMGHVSRMHKSCSYSLQTVTVTDRKRISVKLNLSAGFKSKM